jgi:quercetin dioxygenase-like cupin family protein
MKASMIFAIAIALPAAAAAADMAMPTANMQAMQADEVKWGPAPAVLPPGAQLAVLAGNPAAKGFVSLRAKLPAGYVIPPHTHPTDEHVVVISGDMSFGMGDKMAPAMEKTLQAGGYFVAQSGMHHYARTTSGAVIQVDMEGPFELTYVNPADDPRNKGK